MTIARLLSLKPSSEMKKAQLCPSDQLYDASGSRPSPSRHRSDPLMTDSYRSVARTDTESRTVS